MLRLSSYSVKDATSWLSNHGLSVSGTKQELNQRIRLYQRYPKLTEKLQKRSTYNRSFKCSLEEKLIPPITAPWKADCEAWPLMTEKMFTEYCSFKREGNIGQQAKAVRMLESRKIVSVKTLSEENELYVRALVNPSYGATPRPAVLLFINGKPAKSYCECPVGPSGICCHVLAVLLFLKNYWETGEALLQLTCTQQLQKWHRRCKKGSIPMLPLAQIKVKAAKIRKAKSRKQLIVAADPDKSSFSRDVPTLLKNTSKLIDQTGLSVMDHFHSVLSQSKIGHQSSFGEHINYIYSRESLNNHDYTTNLIFVPRCNPNLSGKLLGITSETTSDAIVFQDIIPLYM